MENIECPYCKRLNSLDALKCSHCGSSLKNGRRATVTRVREEGFYLGLRAKASILFLVFAMIYLVAPIDIFPMSFFDDLALVIIAIVVWIVAVVIENSEGRYKEVISYVET